MPAILEMIAGMARSFYGDSCQVPICVFILMSRLRIGISFFSAFLSWRTLIRHEMQVKVLTRRA